MKKYARYFILFVIVLLGVYALFTIVAASFNPFAWESMTRIHFVLYGFVVNALLIFAKYVDDHFNPSKK
jgi:hypothetical protein